MEKKHKNREKERLYSKESRARKHVFLFDYLLGKCCVDCKNDDILVLEFDHKDSKTKHKAVTRMVTDRASVDNILEEIKKCDIVCSNCHSKRTMKRGNHWRYKLALSKGLLKS